MNALRGKNPFQMKLPRYSSTVVCAAAFGFFSSAAVAEKTSAPNVVIVFLDDSGYSDFRPFGDPGHPTPNVEKLAADGVRFTRFYVP